MSDWKLVPIEPTEEMRAAAEHEIERSAVLNYGAAPNYEDLWSWMLTAAPTPPAQEDELVAWPPECEELCQAAEGMQRAINELWKAEYPEELDEDQKHMGIDEARELHTGACNSLHTAMHYMRKRMCTPLYTRPDNSGLRKAAEEACGEMGKFLDGKECYLDDALINLRDALEGK